MQQEAFEYSTPHSQDRRIEKERISFVFSSGKEFHRNALAQKLHLVSHI
jgi:hypothetical protein